VQLFDLEPPFYLVAVVACGDHPQVGAQLAVMAGVDAGLAAVAVAEAGAEAVGAVLSACFRNAGLQGILQRLGQGDKALTAVDHLHMTPV